MLEAGIEAPRAYARRWQSGSFWVSYAARRNLAFDAISCQKIDERFLVPAESPVES